jgi:hypothetical protein
MNSSWFKILLIISLGLNCMIAGAFVYRFVWGRPLQQFFGGPPACPAPFFSALPPKNIAAHEQLREKMMAGRRKIGETKNSLMEVMAAPNPDRRRIDEQLDAINKQQADMERMAVEQMLEDIQSLPAEKRAAFIEDIQQSMYCRRGDGPGMGWVREGRGGGRHRPRDFQP